MCHARVTINTRRTTPYTTEPCPKCPSYTTPKYTCAPSAAAIKTYLEKGFKETINGSFVPICDACAPGIIATQPPHHRLSTSTSTALSPTFTLKSYEPCECSNEFRTVIDQSFCYPCARKTIDPRDQQIIARLIDHPSHTDPLPPKHGWTCLCGKNFDTKTHGRSLHMASICLGCAHYKIRNPEPSPRSSVSSSSTLTESEGFSSPRFPSSAPTTPTSPPPNPTTSTFHHPTLSYLAAGPSSEDQDQDSPMAGTEPVDFNDVDYQPIGLSRPAMDDEDVGPMGERLEDL
jgi:hypothetical protein